MGTGGGVVRDESGDDCQDGGDALAAVVEPGEQPVLPAQDQPAQLALAAVVGRLDVAVFEEQHQPMPLAVEVAERAPEPRPRRYHGALVLEPLLEVVEDGAGELMPPLPPLLGVVAGEGRGALDGEDTGDLLEPLEGDAIMGASQVDQSATAMAPAPRPLATSPLDEGQRVGAVALHRAGEKIGRASCRERV